MSQRKLKIFLNKLFKSRGRNLILVVSRDSAFREPLKKELKDFGFKVFEFDYRKSSLVEKCIYVASLFYPPLRKLALNQLNRRLLRFASSLSPSIVFVSKGELIFSSTIKAIKRRAITINWFSDLFVNMPFAKDLLKSYDFVFTADKYDMLKNSSLINIFHLPYAARSKQTIEFEKRPYNLVFIGAYSRDRENLLHKLSNFNPHIWGDKKWETSKVKSFYKHEWLTPEKVSKVFGKTKIALNQHQIPTTVNTTVNMRVFEATANGAMVITDFRKDLPHLFNIKNYRKEVVLYRNFSEAQRLIKYYTQNDGERIEVARRGYLRTQKAHTYSGRLNTIFSIINFSNKLS